MDYENLYKKALERARVWKEKSGMPKNKQGILDDIFPELKESEDERIRKSLIILLQHFCKGYRVPGLDFPVSYEDMLAWIKKQGEQKPIIEMKSAEESLGIDSETYNKIVDECIYGEQKSQRMISAEAKEAMYGKPSDKVEQKSSWTKEDDVRLQACIDTLQAKSLMGKVDTVMTKWLKSLKQRIGG